MFIYKIINSINNNFYIGKTTKSVLERYNHHLRSVKDGSNTKLHNAIRKYGKENFILEVVEVVENYSNLNDREIFYISSLNPHYNMTLGGDGGDTSESPNYKKNHYKNCLRNKNHPRYGKRGSLSPVYGRRHNDDTLILMSNTHSQLRRSNRITCVYCNKDIDFANYSRWHGLKCKSFK